MQSDSRNFVMTAAVSLLLVAFVVVIYDVWKPRTEQPKTTSHQAPKISLPGVEQQSAEQPVVRAPERRPEGPIPGISSGNEPEISPEPDAPQEAGFEISKQIQPIPDAEGRADQIRIRTPRGDFMFHMTAIESLPANSSDPGGLQALAERFHRSPASLLALGKEAYQETLKLLQEKPVTLFTRWEPAGPAGHYQAWLLVEHKPGVRSFLNEILVARGYALVKGPTEPPPVGGFTGPEFLSRLQEYETRAAAESRGAWAN